MRSFKMSNDSDDQINLSSFDQKAGLHITFFSYSGKIIKSLMFTTDLASVSLLQLLIFN